MLKQIIKPSEQLHLGVDIIRIIAGIIIIVFSFEIIDSEKMGGYTQWLTDVGFPLPNLMAHVGKLSEMLGGLLLVFGLFTRLAVIPLSVTMFVITFIMLDGNPLTDSFYLLLIFASFFFMGSGKMSVDYLMFKRQKNV